MRNTPRPSYRVPSGLPFRLAELRTKLAALGGSVGELDARSHPLEWDAAADHLYETFRVAANIAPPKTATDCARHPAGAIDPEAPEGWSRCLLCNDRRRRATRGPIPPPAPRFKRGDLGYSVPPPPFSAERVHQTLRVVNDLLYPMGITSPQEDFEPVADALHEAFCIARELSRPRNESGCARHAGGPRDLDGACLLCRLQSRNQPSPAPSPLPRRKYLGGQWRDPTQ
jgi:hypothetical protein